MKTFVPLIAVCALGAVPARSEIVVVELTGVVHAVSAGYVVHALDRAEEANAPLIILRLDTPGGLDTSMRQIIDKMLNCRVPVAVFVGPSGARAASAGFLITVVADVAAMAPGTNMGAAHPVSGMGEMDETMKMKVASDAAAYIRSKVERRGRNVELAEKAVIESKSFTDQEALDSNLVDLVVQDVSELIRAVDGRTITRFDGTKVKLDLQGQSTRELRMDWHQAILSTIARPEILFLLLLGALAGLGTEISHPGLIFPGVIGVLCLILFLFASQIIPINWAGVLLIVLAIGLFAAEVKVASYGLLTIGGLVAMVLGAMMLIDTPAEIPDLRVPLRVLLPAVVATAAWTILLVSLVVRSQNRKATTGVSGLVDQVAEAETELSLEGWIIVQGERWRALADAPVAAGEKVVVTAVEGLTLHVRRRE
ncbi:MAG: nodulation protein NfeD [Vicinamibacteria bacterium]|nr:nodulation protein NfeD [Vicinamibacteria bacterium]